MADPRLAMRPKSGSSMYFAIGAPGNEPQLKLARQWALAIKGQAGDEITVGDVGSFLAVHDQLFRVRGGATPPALADVTATGPARGLPGHTLVLIGLRHRDPAGGLVLSGHLGFGQTDVILSSAALDRFDGLATVTAKEQQRYDLAMFAWTLVSHVTSVVLLGVGPGDALDEVATNLARRTLCPVFYNRDAVRFVETNGTLTKVEVGEPAVTGPAFADATQTPSLTASASQFLPGSQRRADPPKVLP